MPRERRLILPDHQHQPLFRLDRIEITFVVGLDLGQEVGHVEVADLVRHWRAHLCGTFGRIHGYYGITSLHVACPYVDVDITTPITLISAPPSWRGYLFA